MAVTENNYIGNGSTVLYSFTFPYLDTADIRASLDDVATTEYTLANATTIQFNTAPGDGVAIRIYRSTDDEDLNATFYPGSAIRAQDLNDNFTQLLYITQESVSVVDDALDAARQAVQDAAVATATANAASSLATTADGKADSALSSAATATSTANTALGTANTALTSANDAETLAQAALDAVSNALNYVYVANVAAIPPSPALNDAVQVVDSTGIESFTPLTGLPAGFVGDSGLYVRLIFNGTSWSYQGYGPNDPEARYLSTGDVVDSVTSTSTTAPAAANAAKTAYDAANTAYDAAVAAQGTADSATSAAAAAQATANAALPKTGGTMTGTITFAGGQTISGYALLSASQAFTAAQRGSVVALASGTNIAVNLALGNNFSLTLTSNGTLSNPTNQTAGQHGVITITQDGAGSRTLAYGSNYKFPGGTAPNLTTTAGAVDLLVYYVESASRITCRLVNDVK